MAEFKLGRIRFVWKSDWATSTTYYKDDVVKYGGKAYICITGHAASTSFYTDLDAVPSKWNLMSDGQAWRGSWTTATSYNLNDIVKYGGRTYICKTTHTSAATLVLGLETDSGKWDIFAEGTEWKGAWAIDTRYKARDLISYGGITYVCTTYHTSALTTTLGLEADSGKWEAFNEGITFKGTWSNPVRYKQNDVVKYGANLWICVTYHTSTSSFSTDASNWSVFVEGIQYESTWSGSSSYQPGDVVSYGGNQYVAKTNHINQTPSTSTANWDLFSRGMSFVSDWSSVTTYKVGEVVRLNGYTYLAILDGINHEPPNATYWDRLNSGTKWLGEWSNSTDYKLGDVVRFGTNAYICALAHTSADDDSTVTTDNTKSPGTDLTATYWNIFNVGSEYSLMTTTGDMVYYSGIGPTRLPIGEEGQVLKVNSNSIPEWAYLNVVDHTYYVTPDGVDSPAPARGRTIDKAWASIRYACEQIEKGCRNPNAQYLLEMNRVFIQREVTEWIDRQISTATIGTTWYQFDYDEHKCERDTGFIVDRLIWDIGHGGNLKMLAAALAYINSLASGGLYATAEEGNGTGTYSNLTAESAKDVLAYNFMLTLVEKVLNNQAPTISYQVLNGDNSTAIVGQYFDTSLTAETGIMTTITGLVGIVTTALTDKTTTNLPARSVPANLVHVKPGVYFEILPIIVPAETTIVGDETRAVTVGPYTTSLIHKTDAKYTIDALARLESVVGDIILGSNVTESSGNTSIQNIAVPFAETADQTALKQLARMMKYNIDYELGTMHNATMTDPTGYNASYLIGYSDARKLLKENKSFIQEEVLGYLITNYPNLRYGKTKTRQDVGHIIDALVYSLTYGGNALSIQAGLAYYDAEGSVSMLPASIKTATLASHVYLKTVVNNVIDSINVATPYQTAVVQYTDTAGSAAAKAAAGANLDIIYNLINGGNTTSAPNLTITLIAGTTTLTSTGHTLAVGDTVVPRTTANGLTAGTKYYVKTIASNTFTLAASFNGTAITSFSNGVVSVIADIVSQPAATDAVTTTTALIAAYTSLTAQIPTIGAGAVTTVTTAYPTLVYSTTKTSRDVAIVLEAVGYDFMFNGNYRTVKAAYAYRRANSVELYTTTNLKAATRAALSYAKTQAKASVGGDATAQARIETLMTLVDDIIFGASTDGSVCQTEFRTADYARLQLERNREYILAEMSAYMATTYTGTVTASNTTTDIFTISSTSWLQRGSAIRFSGTVFGGVNVGMTYYVQNVVSSTTFTVSNTRYATTPLNLSTVASGSMTVSFYFNTALCLRDVGTMLDAFKFDLMYPGNYQSYLAAKYYVNAVIANREENMFLVRNGTGIRNMTLTGLQGDLTPENAYGTSRTTAGAYVSLDPGWGPADFRTWIISRSPYIQNNATFGYAAIGQKIDGSLHNGGNKSIVSNDFTQLISDGIGAWVTNNARAELVSVFSYYSHIGYLAENGGRIRGTNGNNSYGDFGSVAEGFDNTEVQGTAVVDNKSQFKAVVGKVSTNLTNALAFEYDHAGADYNEATWLLVGPGNFGDVEQDEFRDDGVNQIRLLDNVDDSTGAPIQDGDIGGLGYVFKSSAAQNGSSTNITLAATDDSISSAYIGMKLFVVAGNGVGQFGLISAYDSGTKIASVIKETTGAAGWDHIVPGTVLVDPDSSSSYTIEPAISFTAPTFSVSAGAGLPTSGTWSAVKYGNTSAVYTSLTGTYSGTGATGATWEVARVGSKYFVTKLTSGTGYTRLQTITILGTSLGGLTTANDLVITITSVNSATGAIQAFEFAGYGLGGRYVAVRSGSQIGATSEDGITWSTRTSLMPSGAAWNGLAFGTFNDGSSAPGETNTRFVAIAGTSANTTSAYSVDGITWTATSMVTSATWTAVCFGEGRFVAIASDSTTVRISLDGENWDVTGTLARTGYTCVAYGLGLYVAARSGSTIGAWSTDGQTWTEITMPSASSWHKIAFGNGRFVAIGSSSSNVTAYSVDGKNWYAGTLPATTSWTQVAYGQGVFYAVSGSTQAATSEDGINWTSRTTGTAASGFSDITFGNPQRTGRWAMVGGGTGTVHGYSTFGARAKARAYIASGQISVIRITEPGSGYTGSVPTMTIVDPNNIYEAPFTVYKDKGVLANPSFKNRGTGYITCSAEISTGDGYAETFQYGSYVAVSRISVRPVPGSNVVFQNISGTYKVVSVVSFRGEFDGSYTAFYQVSPVIKNAQAPGHNDSVSTRIRYSQVRLTGHDFLNIGYGNFEESNYPYTPTQDLIQANETAEGNGGRVFFTSTDQDGNFRVGDLFTIEQSTGVATLNADAFNISGLQELSLGALDLGGGSATITEFSTDPFFTANSDSVIPTQRAIKAYIASQIGGGGASLVVNSVTAGNIFIATNVITTVAGEVIQMNAKFDFRNGVTGVPLAFNYFLT
jgi:hypothetical protein